MNTTKEQAEIRRRQMDAGIVMLGLLALDLPPVSWTVDESSQQARLEGLASTFTSPENDIAVVNAWAAHFDVAPVWEVAASGRGGFLKAVTAVTGVHVEVWAGLRERPEGFGDAK